MYCLISDVWLVACLFMHSTYQNLECHINESRLLLMHYCYCLLTSCICSVFFSKCNFWYIILYPYSFMMVLYFNYERRDRRKREYVMQNEEDTKVISGCKVCTHAE